MGDKLRYENDPQPWKQERKHLRKRGGGGGRRGGRDLYAGLSEIVSCIYPLVYRV